MSLDLLFIILALLLIVSTKIHPQAHMNFTTYCQYLNYPIEQHTIQTADGYLLTFFRIQKKGTQIQNNLTPIWLQHGMFDSSDTWILNDENNAPGLLLANKGYDVWFGNSRGNVYSKGHIKLNSQKNKKYWEFSFQHMATYDLPAGFSYINQITKKKINYLGHSQGTLIMNIALSQNNPIVEQYLDKYFAFGSLAFTSHQNVQFLNLMMKSKMFPMYKTFGIMQVMKREQSKSQMMIDVCGNLEHSCNNFVAKYMDTNSEIDNQQRMDIFAGHFPSGTSIMNVLHFRQLFLTGRFQAYNYGSNKKNQQAYGDNIPPSWNPNNIKQKMRIFAGKYDKAATIPDIDHFWSLLRPQVRQFKKTYDAGHATFLIGKDTSPWINDVYQILEQ